ncbi:uncharacterized protein STEHIDRAFT_171468 [Stereum hirsutum FP-91666 SS1]|uniref:uncharacterized protein n=1 Tax=Stereum hirsutum (strain FP-91666) TaxID=721885 RepID=UPI0004449C7C|nr:uncharacterized protein STEHIDRAFT_171468 [Stereum hirsutum FP-91666 SS1]EIM81794.1 hypothetical protein STEHIDRAFT_171468 [Stereum hirsutum FP-91666 SS1]
MLQAIAVNVMFLNLRNINGRAEPTDFAPSLPELNFTQNRFLGNIGAPVEPEQWDNLDVFEEQLETSGTEDWTATSTAFTADADEVSGAKILSSFVAQVDISIKEATEKTSYDLLVLFDAQGGSWRVDDPPYDITFKSVEEYANESAPK